MRNSLRKKYALTGVVLIMAFLLVSLLLNSLLKEPFLIWENHHKMSRINRQVQDWMEKDFQNFQDKIEELGFEENVKISVFDEDFQLLATTQPQMEAGNHSNIKIARKLREIQDILEQDGEYFEDQEKTGCVKPYAVSHKGRTPDS